MAHLSNIPTIQKTVTTEVLPPISDASGLNAQIIALSQVQQTAGQISSKIGQEQLQYNRLQLSQSAQHLNDLHSDIVNNAIKDHGHVNQNDISQYQHGSEAYKLNIHILPGNKDYADSLLNQTISTNVNSMNKQNAAYQFKFAKNAVLSSVDTLSGLSSIQFQAGNYDKGLATLSNAESQIVDATNKGLINSNEADKLKYKIQTNGKVNYYSSQFSRAARNNQSVKFLANLAKNGIPNTTLDQRNKIFNQLTKQQQQINIVKSSNKAINQTALNNYLSDIKSGQSLPDDKKTATLVNNLPTKSQNVATLKVNGAVYQRGVNDRLLGLPMQQWNNAKNAALKKSGHNPFAVQDISKIDISKLKDDMLKDPVGQLEKSNDFKTQQSKYIKVQIANNTAQQLEKTPEELSAQFNLNYQSNILNVPQNKLKPISNEKATGFASQLTNASTLNDQLPILQNIQSTYGSESDKVLQQIYNAGAKDASPLYVSAIQTPLGKNYSKALETSYQNGSKSVSFLKSPADKAAIDARIDKKMQSFINSMQYNNLSDTDLQSINNQVKNFAYVLDGEGKLKGTTLSQSFDGILGNNAKESADIAVDTLVNQHFQYKTGHYMQFRLGKNLKRPFSPLISTAYNLRLPQDISFNNVMKLATKDIGNNIYKSNFKLPQSIINQNPQADIKTLKQNYRQELLKNGQYISTPDNQGVIFVDQLGSPVKNNKGQVYRINLKDTK